MAGTVIRGSVGSASRKHFSLSISKEETMDGRRKKIEDGVCGSRL